MLFLQILSKEGRGVRLCREHLKPNGPKGIVTAPGTQRVFACIAALSAPAQTQHPWGCTHGGRVGFYKGLCPGLGRLCRALHTGYGLRRDFRPKSGRLSVTLSVGTPPMSLRVAYSRVLGLIA